MKRVYNCVTCIAIIMVAMTGCTKNVDDEWNGNGVLKINGQEYSITESYMTVINDTQINSLNFQKKDESHVFIALNSIELTPNSFIESDDIIESVEIVIYETMFIYINDILLPLITETRYLDTKNFKMGIDIKDKTYDVSIIGKTSDLNGKNYDYSMVFKGEIRVKYI